MGDLSPDRVRTIREGCEGVTPGPWEVRHRDEIWTDASRYIATAASLPEEGLSATAKIAIFLARLDPQTVAALCDDWLRMREALTWYAEQAEGCRKLTREGDTARHALDADGGKRARSALSQATGKTK